MTNKEKAEEIATTDSLSNNPNKPRHFYHDLYVGTMEMAEWKDEQYRIDKAHLNMIYEALDRLYKVQYGDQPILNTGSQTDVFLYMIEDIIDDTKQKKKKKWYFTKSIIIGLQKSSMHW